MFEHFSKMDVNLSTKGNISLSKGSAPPLAYLILLSFLIALQLKPHIFFPRVAQASPPYLCDSGFTEHSGYIGHIPFSLAAVIDYKTDLFKNIKSNEDLEKKKGNSELKEFRPQEVHLSLHLGRSFKNKLLLYFPLII